MEARTFDYWLILIWALVVPIPLAFALFIASSLCMPFLFIYEGLFYLSLDSATRHDICSWVGWSLGRGDEIAASVLIAEVQFLIIGLAACGFLAIARKMKDSA